ncbi:hypothetical protein J5N97_024778 [Dioscorea zingiberensis]|uniref:E2 ubiquitin-conjugating enzyme n=1 Tax=Dioscorea zingiberensis TaxID=325984 RepID=A0A9D5H8Y0_9LILI|nr:hypothetical protein J5N97_024778 [Dioscorea zingiberensis]
MDPTLNVSESIVDGNSASEETNKPQRPSPNLPNDVFIYRQDVVRCKHYKDLLGVVLEVAGDESDSEGSVTDDSESDEDENRHGASDATAHGNGGDDVDMENSGNVEVPEENDSLPDGQVRIIWADSSETTNDLGDIEVVDRGFLHGDIIASLSDPTGQLGLVVDVGISVDLQAVNGDMIKDVSSRDLKRIREFSVGDYVVSGPWLGRVNDVLDNVTVMFDDGSVCKVLKADPLRLKAVSKPVVDDANCPYYPGQRVKASSSVFKNGRWLSGLWKASRYEGTVTKVEVASVVVYWIASAYLGVGTNSGAVPSEEQSPKNLTLLSCFSYSNWQLGDWCLLTSAPPSSFSHDANGTSTTRIKESSGECRSYLKYPEVCSINQCKDIHETNYAQGSEPAFDVPDLVTPEHQMLDELDIGLQTQDDALNSSHLSRSDILDHQLVSGHQSLSSDAPAECHSQSTGAMKPNTVTKLGETNTIESDNVLAQCDSSNGLTAVSMEAHESWPLYRKKLRKVLFKRDKKARKRDETFEKALCIVNIRTTVDVAWQDGTREFERDSTSLIPIHSPNDHEFFPEQYVVEQASGEGDDSSETKRVGVVRSVNSKERTVCVRWCKPASCPEDTREFDFDEMVSAYELDGHPDYDYCYGDVVVRLAPASDSAENAYSGSPDNKANRHIDPTEEAAVSMENSHNLDEQIDKDDSCANFTSLSWVGNITGLREGDIEVTWADGMVSMVGPQAVYVVSQEDDGDSFDGGSEVSDAAASWETVDEDEMDAVDNNEKEADPQCPSTKSGEEEKTTTIPPEYHCERNGPLSMPLAALGFVTRLATGLFSRGKRQAEQSELEHLVAEETEVLDGETADDKHSYHESDAVDNHNNPQNDLEMAEEHSFNLLAEDTDVKMGKDLDSSIPLEIDSDRAGLHTKDGACDFGHFDITENPLDHHFLGGSGQGVRGRKWVKKIQQEWNILEKNLPDAIYVRVFEDRMDLLRAVIVGACGTPYQDGLFFFDFQLLPDYPQVPPSAFYHSGGLRINPNLYVDGKVCLSLLNTWTGKGNEVWDPSTSSVLQVLVSLQGLVLNAKPYFNEAGYEKQVGTIEGEKNSLPYNENTYLLNLKSMLYLLRRPPMHFEHFVKDHFRKRGLYILKACEAYMSGCMIASLTVDANMTEKSRQQPCSVGFKLMLAKMIPRLISAFSDLGVDCHQFEPLLKS